MVHFRQTLRRYAHRRSNTEEDEDSPLIDSVDSRYHGSETDTAMNEVMDPLYDEEMIALVNDGSSFDQVTENVDEPGINRILSFFSENFYLFIY